MSHTKRQFIWSFFLVLVIVISLVNVNVALADDTPPPPAPTAEATQPPEEPTATLPAEEPSQPIEEVAPAEEPASEEETAAAENGSVLEILSELPTNTDVVVLDEAGNTVPLASQTAAEAILEIDPMWCPEGVLPGGTGCTANFASIALLLSDMDANTSSYASDGVIYFTATAGGSLVLNDGTLPAADYNTLKGFNLTFQGGWNGSTVSPIISGQTNFANNSISIGSWSNPWDGNITLNDITFTNAGSHAVLIVTTSGTISLDNVDVNNQLGGSAAILDTASGNIFVQDGAFDGDDFNGGGLSATTGTGSVTITNSSFTDFKSFAGSASGITINAPIVTLTNVTESNSDGDGINISNANHVTLNNVTASNNGTELGAAGLADNIGSGVYVSGPAGSSVSLLGGTFNNNQEYGVEIGNPANTTLYIQSPPTCTGNDSNDPPTSSCYNVVAIPDGNGPVISPMSNIIQFADYDYGKTINYSTPTTYDAVDGPGVATCSPPSGSVFAIGTTIVTCTATDNAGNTSVLTFAVIIRVKTTSATEGTSAGGAPIAVTGGEVIDLTCPMSVSAFGVLVTFHNLCEHQAVLNEITEDSLPEALPAGYSFVRALDVEVLADGEALDTLPDQAGVEMDYPLSDGTEFVVLFWNGTAWVEITQPMNAGDLASVLSSDAGNGLYKMSSSNGASLNVLTTGSTGTFVLVAK